MIIYVSKEMMDRNKDILQDFKVLKENAFTVPEGYFDAARSRIRKHETTRKTGLWERMSPYAAIAAVFVFMVTAGTFFLEKTTRPTDMTQEDYIVFSDAMMNTVGYSIEYDSQIADAELGDEDIINYLIYMGISAEEIETSK